MNRRTAYAARLRLRCSNVASRIGRVPVLGTLLRRIGTRLVPRGTLVWARIRNGPARDSWILLDVRGGSDFLRGDREPPVQQILSQWLSPGHVFYDVGANAGYFCLVASKMMKGKGKIFAFEAEPDVTFRLRSIMERNALTEVTVVEKAVWSESGTVSFERGLGSPDRLVGHVTAGDGNGPGDCVTVPAISLDDFMCTASPPDVVKCDVEGAETEVFRGAAKLLAICRPKVICEVHSPENLQEVRAIFERNHYRVRLLEPEERFPIHIVAETSA